MYIHMYYTDVPRRCIIHREICAILRNGSDQSMYVHSMYGDGMDVGRNRRGSDTFSLYLAIRCTQLRVFKKGLTIAKKCAKIVWVVRW